MILSLWDGLVSDRHLEDRLQAVFDDFRLIDARIRPTNGCRVTDVEHLARELMGQVRTLLTHVIFLI